MAFMVSVGINRHEKGLACIHKSKQVKRGVLEVVLNDLHIP